MINYYDQKSELLFLMRGTFMFRHDIEPYEGFASFEQLLGMCDNITFTLGNAVYSSYNYVPYGFVDKVMPYLTRSAQENKSVMKKLEMEIALHK